MLDTAQIDALFEIDGAAERLVIGRIARGDAFHAGACVMMAIGASLADRTGLLLPQRFALDHAQHARIGRVVILHRLAIWTHEGIAGSALGCRDFSRDRGAKNEAGRRNQQRCEGYRCLTPHSTVMLAEAVSEKPLSPIHSKSNFPLLLAMVKKEMKGLAAVPG